MAHKLLDFYADWCGPCKTQASIFEEFAESRDDVVMGEHGEVDSEGSSLSIEKVNVDSNKELANDYQVQSIPTLVLLDGDREMVERWVGVTQPDDIEAAMS